MKSKPFSRPHLDSGDAFYGHNGSSATLTTEFQIDMNKGLGFTFLHPNQQFLRICTSGLRIYLHSPFLYPTGPGLPCGSASLMCYASTAYGGFTRAVAGYACYESNTYEAVLQCYSAMVFTGGFRSRGLRLVVP